MARIPLNGRAYQERSLIANSLKTVNMYAESNKDDPEAPVPFTYYQTPGLDLVSTPNNPGKARCTYRTSIGTAYVVIENTVYFLATNNALVFVGSIPDRISQVYMADNGLVAVLVDGVNGWVIDLSTNEFAQIIDPSFYGADFVVYLDTFFVFNRPATDQFYISLSQVDFGLLSGTAIGSGTITNAGSLYTDSLYLSVPLTGGSGTGATANITIAGAVVTDVVITTPGKNYLVGDTLSADTANIGGTGSGFIYTIDTFALAFDPLDIAAKSGSADPIVAILTYQKQLWLIGALTTEIWIGTGAADFYFQLVQGAYIDHGCIAPYTAANTDIVGFWLMQDRVGKNIIVKTEGYGVVEISTPFLVKEFDSYITTSDAIGFCWQQEDHAFYVLIFQSANKTWLYELKTQQWNEWSWLNTDDGSYNRHRANCGMYFNGKNLIGDWETGKIYALNSETYTDAGNPIVRIKTFLHMVDNMDRVGYPTFDADIEPATQAADIDTEPLIFLSWSDDRGVTFGNPVAQSMGKGGQTLTTISWNRLGMARDRVFKLQTSVPIKFVLNGGFANVVKARS
jgi:hypothetical protein